MRRYAYARITLAFFIISIVLHGVFGWFTLVDAAGDHGVLPELTPYLTMAGRNMCESWRSEFLQLLWLVGLACLLDVGPPASQANDDRMKAKIGALLELGGKVRAALITRGGATHDRRGGHARIHADLAFNG